MNYVCRRHSTGPICALLPGTAKEADRLNQIALMEMTLCIYANTPLQLGPFKLAREGSW